MQVLHRWKVPRQIGDQRVQRLPEWVVAKRSRTTLLLAMRAWKSKPRQWQHTVSTLFQRAVPTVAGQHVVHRLFTRPVRIYRWIRVLHRLRPRQACVQPCVHPLHHVWHTRIPTSTQRHRLPEHSTRSLPIWTHHTSHLPRGKVWCGWQRYVPRLSNGIIPRVIRQQHVPRMPHWVVVSRRQCQMQRLRRGQVWTRL